LGDAFKEDWSGDDAIDSGDDDVVVVNYGNSVLVTCHEISFYWIYRQCCETAYSSVGYDYTGVYVNNRAYLGIKLYYLPMQTWIKL
jgi:hypothetical protein